MGTKGKRLTESARIIAALAAKDIVDAVKNKTTLSVVITTLFLVVFYRFLPLLEGDGGRPRVRVSDPGGSALVAALEASPAIDVRPYSSPEDMATMLRKSDVAELGLVVPADFDREVAAGGELALDGYAMHWIRPARAGELAALAEQELAAVAGRAVEVRLEGHRLYPRADSTGYAFVASASLVIAVLMVGVSLVGNLLLEEKQARTMDALLVSPAGAGEIVLGKAAAGLFYGLAAVAVVLGCNAALVTHWALAIGAAGAGVLLGVALGLLLGSLLNSRQQLQVWAWTALFPLLLPVFLSIMTDLLPAALVPAVNWTPTVALARVLRVSFSDQAPVSAYGPELAVILGCAAVVLAAVAAVVRRADR